MRKIPGMITMLLLMHTCIAQPFGVGSVIKDMKLEKIVNHTAASAKLSAFNDKPLVLIFWLSTCGSCMGSIGKTDSLSKKYKGKVNMLMVTSQATKEIQEVFKTKRFNGFVVPSVTADKEMIEWFPNRGVPHYVWINSKGKVEAISGGKYFNDSSLALFAAGKPLQLPLKSEEMDTRKFFSLDPIILYDYEQRQDEIMSYSFFTAPRAGILATTGIKPGSNHIRIIAINTGYTELYKMSYGGGLHASQFYIADSGIARKMREKVCYDMIIKDTVVAKARRFMQQDLDRHLNVHSRIEMEWQRCYVLKLKEGNVISVTKGTGQKMYTDSSELMNFGATYPIEAALTRLPLPVINEAPIKYDFQIELPKDKGDVGAVRRFLERYGLILAEEERKLVKLVIE